MVSRGAMYTLNSTEVHCVAYSIHSYNSEGALKSKTPYAHVVDKSKDSGSADRKSRL